VGGGNHLDPPAGANAPVAGQSALRVRRAAKGAGLIFVLLHCGISDAKYSPDMEKPGRHVA